MKNNLLALVYGAIGGIVGYFAVPWIWSQGFYAIMLPGTLLGFGAGFSKSRSNFVAVICGIAGTLVGFYTEWRAFFPQLDLSGFLKLIPQLEPIALIMIALGGFLGFWLPYRSTAGDRTREIL
jgi:hypothetical protein